MKLIERERLCRNLWDAFNNLTVTLQNVTGTVRYDMPKCTEWQAKTCDDIDLRLELLYGLIAPVGNAKLLPLCLERLDRSEFLGNIDHHIKQIGGDLERLINSIPGGDHGDFFSSYVERRINRFDRLEEALFEALVAITRAGKEVAK